jgi:glycosyltransferase involved in cell wall biosynthesis
MNKPLFSIITPSYNQGKYIKKTIQSVLDQGYDNTEHIVIDGGSTDDTVCILKSYTHLTWISEKDRGQSDALNKGFSAAKGDFIGWINSDDWYAPGIFNDVAHALQEYPLCFGKCMIVDGDEKPLYEVANVERNWFDLIKYWNPYSIPTQPSIFMRRDLLEAVKRSLYRDKSGSHYIDPDLYYVMDYDLWLRIARDYDFSKRIDKIFSYYRMTEDNKTSNKVEGMSYAEPEMSKVFHRAVQETFPYKSLLQYILYPGQDLRAIERTLISLKSAKPFPGDEVIVTWNTHKNSSVAQLKKIVTEFNAQNNKREKDFYCSILEYDPTSESFFKKIALNASSKICFFIYEGFETYLFENVIRSLNEFSNNRLGVVCPWFDKKVYSDEVLADYFLSDIYHSKAIAIRRLSLLDCLPETTNLPLEWQFREIFLRHLCNSWKLITYNFTQKDLIRFKSPVFSENHATKWLAYLINTLVAWQENDVFNKFLQGFGKGLIFSKELISLSNDYLKKNHQLITPISSTPKNSLIYTSKITEIKELLRGEETVSKTSFNLPEIPLSQNISLIDASENSSSLNSSSKTGLKTEKSVFKVGIVLDNEQQTKQLNKEQQQINEQQDVEAAKQDLPSNDKAPPVIKTLY